MFFVRDGVLFRKCRAPVAQLDRVSASEAEGRGFESRRAHHNPLKGDFFCARQAGREPASGFGERKRTTRRHERVRVERPPKRGERSEQSRRAQYLNALFLKSEI